MKMTQYKSMKASKQKELDITTKASETTATQSSTGTKLSVSSILSRSNVQKGVSVQINSRLTGVTGVYSINRDQLAYNNWKKLPSWFRFAVLFFKNLITWSITDIELNADGTYTVHILVIIGRGNISAKIRFKINMDLLIDDQSYSIAGIHFIDVYDHTVEGDEVLFNNIASRANSQVKFVDIVDDSCMSCRNKQIPVKNAAKAVYAKLQKDVSQLLVG